MKNKITPAQTAQAEAIGALIANSYGSQEVVNIVLKDLPPELQLGVLEGACKAMKGLSSFAVALQVKRAELKAKIHPSRESRAMLISAKSLEAGMRINPLQHEIMMRGNLASTKTALGTQESMDKFRNELSTRLDALMAGVQ